MPYQLRERKEPDPNTMLILDRKSKEPREEQVLRQIRYFTRNPNVKRADLTSMDDITDLREIEKDFGKIPLGQ